jgi:acyl-CoA thioester hydrolase
MSERWFETYRGLVLPPECDDFGHLNIAHYVAKFDVANNHIYARIGLTASVRRQLGLACVAAENAIRYRSELRSGDVLVARSLIVGFHDPLIHFITELRKVEDTVASATFEEIACCFDLATRTSTAFPEDVGREIAKLIAPAAEPLVLKIR